MNKCSKFALGAVMALAGLSGQAATFAEGARTDFRDETIYFAMTTRFYDGDHSNNTYCWDGTKNVNDPEWRGDFKGLIEKLDYIKALGFTAVWITPVVENASGLDYHGYHAFNFRKVDPRYESEDVKFQTLIDEVHKRGMKLILDIVLQHNGNFGEEYLCPMFEKDYTQPLSNINKSMKRHPNSMLPENYSSLIPDKQYQARLTLMKNNDGAGKDPHNYWHHVGQAWDWDDYSRVWGQIAGDCVDLNTEHPHVYNYIVKCYTNFINMGVDGFRIDTSGHIARVTFNKAFIPQLHAAAEAAKAKRGGTPFYMFGEVCARAEEVIYRDQNYNCSPCFYTWAEEKDYEWTEDESTWDDLVFSEAAPSGYAVHPNSAAVLSQAADYQGHDESILRKSNNAWLDGNKYHTPDYSQSSHFNVIDFPMHWRFSRAGNAFNVNSQDNLYNDATWNVVYVDGHDYGPNGWDKKSFGGSEAAWAENFALMFTWRGIPCIWQGSECYFRKGVTIDEGPNMALKETARAYFGGYLTGDVTTTDFGEYTSASGNLAATLSHPLAVNLQRLNKIRAAVPALRKGQYSVEGCSGEMAFKRRYTDANTDSYVLVTISGDATFTGIENGTYTDCVTGDVKTVSNGTLSVSCSGQGNLRVYVLSTAKTPAPGKIGEDTKYVYTTTPATIEQKAYDGQEEAGDTETVRDTGGGDDPIVPPVEGGFYLVGNFSGDWDLKGTLMEKGENDIYTTTVKGVSGKHHFCFTTTPGSWSSISGDNRYGSGSGEFAPELGEEYTIHQSNGNCWYYEFSKAYIYTITVDRQASTLTMTAVESGEIDDPDPQPTEKEWVFYFTAGTARTYYYAWHGSDEKLAGSWPGTQATEIVTLPGYTGQFYKVSLGEATLTNPQVIFNNGTDKNKTGDLALVNGGVYDATSGSLLGSVTTGISAVTPVDGIRVSARGGMLFISSPVASDVVVARMDGVTTRLHVEPGVNCFDHLPRGFYIVNRTKIVL